MDVPLVAVTGGIAAGKSTVCARFGELGAHVESADELARFLQAKGSPVLDSIRERFGLGVIAADGELDRAALGRLVFDDLDARRDLESIVHPAIAREFARRRELAYAADPNAIIVYDIPLLVETNRVDEFDVVIVLSCNEDIRHERLIELRGFTPEEATSRIAAQATEEQRIAVADFVIDTGGSVPQTIAQVDAVWSDLVAAFRV
jgi:dephospho-CoA kinase